MAIEGVGALLPAAVSSAVLVSGTVACGRDAITQVPAARWDVHAVASLPEPVASRVRHGGFVCGAELANSAAFSVSAAEAAAMDPCQRLLLERGYAVLHDAAWTARRSTAA